MVRKSLFLHDKIRQDTKILQSWKPRITFLFFSYWDLKVSGNFYFSFQPMCVKLGRVRLDEACDRLQTKTKHYKEHDFYLGNIYYYTLMWRIYEIIHYCTHYLSSYWLYSLSVFSLANSLQLILEISANYRLVSYLLADNWLICQVPCDGVCRYFLQNNV